MKLIGNFILPFPHFSPKMVSRFFLFQSQTKNENCLWNYRSLLLGGLLNVKSMICGLTECCPSIWIPPNQIPSVRNPIIFQKNWLTKKITLKINPFIKIPPNLIRISVIMNTFRGNKSLKKWIPSDYIGVFNMKGFTERNQFIRHSKMKRFIYQGINI